MFIKNFQAKDCYPIILISSVILLSFKSKTSNYSTMRSEGHKYAQKACAAAGEAGVVACHHPFEAWRALKEALRACEKASCVTDKPRTDVPTPTNEPRGTRGERVGGELRTKSSQRRSE